MHCRCFSYTSAVLLLAFGGLMAGCGKEGGSTPDAQVDAFRVSAELDRTKNKLTAAERDSAAKGDAVVLAKDETEAAKKRVAEKEGAIVEREAQIHALQE